MPASPSRPDKSFPPIVVREAELADIEVPFQNDQLNRKPIADRLTGYLERLRVGAVIALDAPWGEGKTWFGRHWTASLREQGYATGWINAFEQDYVEDAFLPLAGAVMDLCATDDTGADRVKASAGAVMRALLPVSTRALINLAGRAVGLSGLADEFGDAVKEAAAEAAKDAGATVGDAASSWVEHRLEEWGQERATVAHFRETLADFALRQYEATGKPVVIVIDELDRCRPAFAVRLVERIKHFFDVPHLVFVLLMNRDQLEKAIRGVYGSETDAATYLGKFLHLSLRLPKERDRDPNKDRHALLAFIEGRLRDHGIGTQDKFTRPLAACAAAFDLSPRDIERACSLHVLAGSHHGKPLAAYLIALKLRRPALYRALETVGEQASAHEDCARKLRAEVMALQRAGCAPDHFPASYFLGLAALHTSLAEGGQLDEDNNRAVRFALDGLNSNHAVSFLMRKLDLDVE